MTEMTDRHDDLERFVSEEQLKGRQMGFWAAAFKRFRKNKVHMMAYRFLLFLVLVAVFADFIAYDKPIVCNRGGSIEFPIVGDYLSDLGLYKREGSLMNQDWKEMDFQWAIWPPVRYLPHKIDYSNQRLSSPFGQQKINNWKLRHFLGTNRDGRDVLSGLVHGTRISLTIGFIATGISSIIGIILGAFAGFFGDHRWQLSTAGIILGLMGLVLGYFYGFQVRIYVLRDALTTGAIAFLWQLFLSVIIMTLVTTVMIQLSRPFKRMPFLGKRRNVWVDVIISRLLEINNTIPAMLLIITVMALLEKKNVYFVMIIIGLLSWSSVARFMRAEMLRTRSMAYIEAARSMGFTNLRVLFRHAVPNSLTSVLVVMTFSISGAISLEAALSFLGIGVPDNVVTWGGLLNEARTSQSAWWMSVFPAMAVFLTITALNLVGEGLRDVLDPRLRNE
jgi:peptide/nickel transport system permease protein